MKTSSSAFLSNVPAWSNSLGTSLLTSKTLPPKPCWCLCSEGVYAVWLSCFIFLSGCQAVLPPSQPPHPSRQVSTCLLLHLLLPFSYMTVQDIPAVQFHPFFIQWGCNSATGNDQTGISCCCWMCSRFYVKPSSVRIWLWNVSVIG